MITLNHKMIVSTLALTVLLSVGSDATYAQKGKSLRGLMNSRSSNNSSSNNNNNSGNKMFSQKNNSNFSFNGLGNNNNSTNNSKGLQGFNSGNLQNSFQNQNNNQNKNRFQDLKKNNDLKQLGNGGLQNWLNKGKGTQSNNNNNNSGLNNLGKFDNKFDNKNNNQDNDHKFQNWLNNQKNKNGNGSKIANLIINNQKQGKLCIDHHDWCNTKPKTCHWWYNYCKPIAYCDPHHQVHCHWNYVTCDYSVGGHVVVADARWYLGMKGLLLPGQGVGIEEVTPGSPAAAVGLQPGMVINRVNGIDLVDETVLAQVIATSGGVLQMDLLLSADGPPATCVVVMQRVASVNF